MGQKGEGLTGEKKKTAVGGAEHIDDAKTRTKEKAVEPILPHRPKKWSRKKGQKRGRPEKKPTLARRSSHKGGPANDRVPLRDEVGLV